MESKKYKVNIVTGKGGGGHYATYYALKAIAQQQQLPWEFQVTDMDDIMATITEEQEVKNFYQLIGSSVSEWYNYMLQSGWTWLWWFQIRVNKLLVKLNYQVGIEYFQQYWREQQPDLVVSVVTMCNKILAQSLETVKPGTPYVTLPIDFADYPPGFWLEPDTNNYTFCATEKILQQARTLGVKEDLIIKTSGMVIHPRFYQQQKSDKPCGQGVSPDCAPRIIQKRRLTTTGDASASRASLRRESRQHLGLDSQSLTGLVLFGGNGSQIMVDIAQKLESFGNQIQVIFLCGRNEKLAQCLKNYSGCQRRFVTTFTEDIPDYMHLADFFIGKPGPGSLSEALVMGLPVITECNFSTLVHERYNAQWISQKRVGIVLDHWRKIESGISQFIQPQVFKSYQTNVAALNNNAVFEVAASLQQILTTHNPRQQTQSSLPMLSDHSTF